MANFDDINKFKIAAKTSAQELKRQEQEAHRLAEAVLKEFANTVFGENSFFSSKWQYGKPGTPIQYSKKVYGSQIGAVIDVFSGGAQMAIGRLPWHLLTGRTEEGKGSGNFFVGVYPKTDKIKVTIGWCPNVLRDILPQRIDPESYDGQIEIEDVTEEGLVEVLKRVYAASLHAIERM
jgi:hypothetical protein